MYLSEFFNLDDRYVDRINKLKPKFGYDGFGEIVFYRTYSRAKRNGGQESWHDCIFRVINGLFSIRKDWYLKNNIEWKENVWQKFAYKLAKSMFKMTWLPPGRGLWAMGTPFIYERGSMALYNCAFTKLGCKDFGNDINWAMDCLMLGVGVGFDSIRDNLPAYNPIGTYLHIISDDREGWVQSVKLLIDAYTKPGHRLPQFDYSHIRPKGLPIHGFGGISSGPEPLKYLHETIKNCFAKYMNHGDYDVIRLKTDIINHVGCCVVAGNVRRSAELGMGWVTDPTFLDLKDYENKYPEREDFGWMSNNAAKFQKDEHYEMISEVSKRVATRGEPGIANLKNFSLGRIGKRYRLRKDKARGVNPCGEIPLEDKETCNVVETYPTMCQSKEEWYEACEAATFYASTVSLFPTHRPETNRVVARNRRIGVSIVDWTGWKHEQGLHKVIKEMRTGYKIVRNTNRYYNSEAGVPEAIRVTTIKPGGTTPKLPGKTPGIGHPTFVETLRRMRIARNHPMCAILDRAGIPCEPEKFDPKNTLVYSYPTKQGPSEPAEKITIWEQAFNLVTVQREWADNSVSNTIYFKPKWVLKHSYRENLHDIISTWKEANPSASEISLKNGCIRYETEAARSLIKFKDGSPEEFKVYVFNPNHEEDCLGPVMAHIMPLIKTASFLPHSAQGVYAQMPEEGISPDEYAALKASIGTIDWSEFQGSDGEDERYCTGPECVIPKQEVG